MPQVLKLEKLALRHKLVLLGPQQSCDISELLYPTPGPAHGAQTELPVI